MHQFVRAMSFFFFFVLLGSFTFSFSSLLARAAPPAKLRQSRAGSRCNFRELTLYPGPCLPGRDTRSAAAAAGVGEPRNLLVHEESPLPSTSSVDSTDPRLIDVLFPVTDCPFFSPLPRRAANRPGLICKSSSLMTGAGLFCPPRVAELRVPVRVSKRPGRG